MTTLVDDSDPRIVYAGAWFTGGGPPEQNNTTHGTYTPGSTASFNFTGISVSVFGTVGPVFGGSTRPPMSLYTLDDLPAVAFTGPLLNSASYHYQFYTSPPLDEGIHQLTITSINFSSTLWLDYIQYTEVTSTPSTSTPSTPISTIIGCAIGGIAALGVVISLVLWFRRRKKRKNLTVMDDPLSLQREDIFPRERQGVTFWGTFPDLVPLRSSGNFISTLSPLRPNRPGAIISPPISDGITPPMHRAQENLVSTAYAQRISQGGTVYQLHADGGVRVASSSGRRVDLPPDYREFEFNANAV